MNACAVSPSPRRPRLLLRSAALAAALALLASCASAGAGHLPPSGVTLIDGDQPRDLDQLAATHPLTVLVWWSSTCPCVARYHERVAALAAAFTPREVAFYRIASNADDGPAEVARAVGDGGPPILRDPGGALSSALGIISTPTVIALDRSGTVRYFGWLDNEHVPGDPEREPWLEDALAALLSGDLKTRRTPFWGCTVTRSLGEERTCTTPPTPTPKPRCH